MASLNVALYDYDGVVYAFGVVRGLYNVSAVRMYLSYSVSQTSYQYYSEDIYTKAEANINTDQHPEPCFVFYIRTDRNSEDGSPKQLDYWIPDENNNGYGRYLAGFHFYSSSGTLLNNAPLYPSYGNYSKLYFQMHNSLTSPLIEYDESKNMLRVYNVGNYRYMVEIVRKNRKDMSYTVDVRDYAYIVLMKNLERGKYWEAIPTTSMYNTYDEDGILSTDTGNLCRYRSKWEDGTNQKAVVIFDNGAGFSQSQKDSYFSIVQSALNRLTELTGISFDIDYITTSDYNSQNYYSTMETLVEKYGIYQGNEYDYNILIRIGNNSTMQGDWIGQGLWNTWRYPDNPEYGIAVSIANINVDRSADYESVNHVIYEEIYQSFGIGADNYEIPMSIHWDPEYCNPESYSGYDAEIMKFIYSQDMCGWDSFDFINNVDTPCILFKEYTGADYYEFDLSKLNPDEYYAYAWVAGEKSNPGGSGTSEFQYWHGGWDDSPYSNKTRISFKNSGRPGKFSWDIPKNKGDDYQVTAEEWNKFQRNVAAVIRYKNVSPIEFAEVNAGDTLTADLYMNTREAIRSISGYGTYIPSVQKHTKITADKSSTVPSENNINIIVDELNAVE